MKLLERIKEQKEGFLLAVTISFLLCVYAPIELFLASQDDFWFDIWTLLLASVGSFLVLFIMLSIGLFLLRLIGKIPYIVGLAVGSAVLLICYVQGSFLVSGMPALDGTKVDWNGHPAERIKSIVLCLLVTAVIVFVILKFKEAFFKKAVLYLSVALFALLGITLTTVCLTTPMVAKDKDLVATGYNDLTYSNDQNFIMLVVDATDSTEFREALAANPEFGDTFDDFTYYDDAATMYPFTLNAIPSMLTGEWNENTTSHREYLETSFKKSPLINQLSKENYKMGLYNKNEIILSKAYEGVFENHVAVKPKFRSAMAAAKTIVKMAAIRYAPWDLKRFGYNLPTYLDDAKFINYDSVKKNNQAFYEALSEEDAITVVQDKCARIIHIEGAHVPYRYDKNVEIKENATYMDNVECTLTVCAKFLLELKESGVYDNSVIVILSDHGYDATLEKGLTARANPVLLVKGRNEKGEEMKLNSTPVSYESLADALTKLLKGEKTSTNLFDDYSYPSGRRFLKYAYTVENHMEEYFIYGRADDLDNIKPSGKVYDLSE